MKFDDLMINERAERKFSRLMEGTLGRNGYDAQSRGYDYFQITRDGITLDFDFSAFKYEYMNEPSSEIFERALKWTDEDFAVYDRLDNFTNGQDFLRIAAFQTVNVTSGLITEDFKGGLTKVLCSTSDNIHGRPLSDNILKQWDMPPQALFSVADRNMARLLRETKYEKKTIGTLDCLEFRSDSSEFASALAMCSDFYGFVSDILGRRFIVCIPSRDSFIALEEPTKGQLSRIADAAWDNSRRSADALTADVLLFTPQGVSSVGMEFIS